jgi:hypothetical protein
MQLIDLKSVLSQRLSARSLPSLIAWWAATLLLVFLAIPAHAQYRASLRGTVADPTGAVIPGATVTLTDKDTNATRTATSDGSGIYTFNALPPDHFSLVAERQGFEKKEVAQVVLIPEQPNTLDVQLQLGDVQQTVTVTGSAAPLLDSGTATVSATISSNEIQHMQESLATVRRAAAEGALACRGTRDPADQALGQPVSSQRKTGLRFRPAAVNMKPMASPSTASARLAQSGAALRSSPPAKTPWEI